MEENSKDVFLWQGVPLRFIRSVPASVDFGGELVGFLPGENQAVILQGRPPERLVRVSLATDTAPPEVLLAVSPDGEWSAAGSADGTVKLWDARPQPKVDPRLAVLNKSGRARFDEHSRRWISVLATTNAADGTPANEIRVYDAATWQVSSRLTIPGDPVLDALPIGDGNRLAVMRADERVEVWDLDGGPPALSLLAGTRQRFSDYGIPFYSLHSFSQRGRLVCVQQIFGAIGWLAAAERVPVLIHVFDAVSLSAVRTHALPFEFGLSSCRFSTDGRVMALGGHDGEIVLIDVESGARLKKFIGHRDSIRGMAFSHDGWWLASVVHDGYVRLWNTATWELDSEARGGASAHFAVAFHPGGDRLITAGEANTLGVWTVPGLRELAGVPAPRATPINRLRFLDDNVLLTWTGHWVPRTDNEALLLHAPEMRELADWRRDESFHCSTESAWGLSAGLSHAFRALVNVRCALAFLGRAVEPSGTWARLRRADSMTNSENTQACRRCGAVIGVAARQGLCPSCAAASTPTQTDHALPAHPLAEAPPVAEVAAAFPRLEIIGLIGQGGMGHVFKARQPNLDRLVALKLLPKSLAARPTFAERFRREARLLARLHHPHIVSVFEGGQAGGYLYLVMEYVEGLNLRQTLRAGRLNPAQALAIVPKICEALQFAHDEGVLHRDIKPENILLDGKGRVKIADFGIAKLLDRPPAEAALTALDATVGTPAYMAPEQIERPTEVDHRADIYSLGVVFYEMLTGELPLGRFTPPSQKVALDARVDAIVLQALAKERESRQQSAHEVKTQIEGLDRPESKPTAPAPLTERDATQVRVPNSSSTPAGWRPRPALAAALVAMSLVLAVLGMVAWFLVAPPSTDPRAAAFPRLFVASFIGSFPLLLALAGTLLGIASLAGLRRPHGDEPGAAFAGFAALTWPLLSLDAILLLGTVWVANVLGSRGPEIGRVLVLAVALAGVVVFDVLVVRGFWRWVQRPRATPSHSDRASDGAVAARNSS